jgi:ketosteroid isomerase-like protein
MAATGQHAPQIPPAVSAWLTAHALHDVDAELAQLASDVVLVDDGHEYSGHDAVREWAASRGAQFEYTATILSTDHHGDAVVATARVEGNFPGSPVNLRYQFLLTDGLISALTIHK